MWIFSDEEVVKLQNRANDLWDTSMKIEDHEQYIAVANRLLGALEMAWKPSNYCNPSKLNKKTEKEEPEVEKIKDVEII